MTSNTFMKFTVQISMPSRLIKEKKTISVTFSHPLLHPSLLLIRNLAPTSEMVAGFMLTDDGFLFHLHSFNYPPGLMLNVCYSNFIALQLERQDTISKVQEICD